MVCEPSCQSELVKRLHTWVSQEEPAAKPTSIGYGHRYWFRVDVECFHEFDIWLQDQEGIMICRGLHFHGSNGSVVVGEWRLDAKVQNHNLPSPMILHNVKFAGRSAVVVDHVPSVAAIRIEGILEWWLGPKGWEIMQVPST